jgi:hypothetical protein
MMKGSLWTPRKKRILRRRKKPSRRLMRRPRTSLTGSDSSKPNSSKQKHKLDKEMLPNRLVEMQIAIMLDKLPLGPPNEPSADPQSCFAKYPNYQRCYRGCQKPADEWSSNLNSFRTCRLCNNARLKLKLMLKPRHRRRHWQLSNSSNNNYSDWIQELTEDELSFHSAVRVLSDHGLVEVDKSSQEVIESRGYSIHGCVHSWTINVLNINY